MFGSLPNLPMARRWRQQAYPVASVLAIIRRGDLPSAGASAPHFLLIQRQTEPYSGKWGLVGGRWEFGETLETAITREVKEETGLDTRFVALRGVVSERIAPSGSDDDGAHFLLFVCELSAPTGIAREQDEGPVAWFGLQDLNDPGTRQQIISSDYAILGHFIQTRDPLAYVEADAVASGGEQAFDRLVRFADMTQKPDQ
jgi:ADP-ribose pyrophosphatase YjhB (NUDIX family)